MRVRGDLRLKKSARVRRKVHKPVVISAMMAGTDYGDGVTV